MLLVAVWGAVPHALAAEGNDCYYCGMRRAEYGHSWVEIRYKDGSVLGFCSLHCASVHLALHPESVPGEIRVGDYLTRKMIDADKAHWVIGGRKMGVMTARAKWAFASRGDAERFVAENGGRLATMDEALEAAIDDMYRDIRAIQKKRKAARTQTMEQNQE